MQIVLLHVQKTAGTTLLKSLSTHFDAEAIYSGAMMPPLKNPKKHIVASHLPLRDHDLTDGRNRLMITAFRDPVERLTSLYRYWRSMRWSMIARNALPEIVLAKQLGFAEWLLHEDVVRAIDNGLVNHFCDNPEASAKTRLSQARANLNKLGYIFDTQNLSEDLEQFSNTLGLHYTPVGVVNATDINPDTDPETFEKVDPVEMTDQTLKALEKRTSLDRELYDFVLRTRGDINGRLAQTVGTSVPRISLRRLSDGTSLLARGLRQNPAVLGGGWASVEDWHVWSVQPVANLFFGTTPEVRSCELKLQAHLPGGCEILKTRLIINETVAINVVFVATSATYRVEADNPEPFLICNGAAPVLIQAPVDIGRRADGRVDIRFEIPNLLSPALLGLNEDTRLLGIALYSLRCSSQAASGATKWKKISDPA